MCLLGHDGGHMDELKIINITDTLDDGIRKSNDNFDVLADAAENIVTGFEDEHLHDGIDSKKVSHDSLLDKGILSHEQIDSELADSDEHITNETFHAGAQFKIDANNVKLEVESARNSSTKGSFSSIGARIDQLETVAGSSAHDSLSGRHDVAQNTSNSRHTASAIWDTVRVKNVQESLDDLVAGGTVEDSDVKSGMSGITQKHLDDRLNSIYSGMPPTNLIPNGTFAFYAGAANNQHKYAIPGWEIDTTDNAFEANLTPYTTLSLSSLPEFDSEEGSLNFISTYANWHGSFVCALTSTANTWTTPPKFCSYPFMAKLVGPYTFIFSYSNPNTSRVKVQIFESEWTDYETVDCAATANGEFATKSFVLSFDNSTFENCSSALVRLVFEPVNQSSGTLNWKIFKVGAFCGNLDSNAHKLPYIWFCPKDISNSPVFSTSVQDPSVFNLPKIFVKTFIKEMDIQSGTIGEYQMQIPPAVMVYNAHVFHGYGTFGNKDAASDPPIPQIKQSGVTVNNFGGVLSPGTYFYRMTFVDSSGKESLPSAILTATVTQNNSSVSFTQPSTIPQGVTQIYLYRGTSADNLKRVRTYTAQQTIQDNIQVFPQNVTPPLYPPSVLNTYNHFAITVTDTQKNSLIESIIVKTQPPYSADGSPVTGKISVEVDYWPGPMMGWS